MIDLYYCATPHSLSRRGWPGSGVALRLGTPAKNYGEPVDLSLTRSS